MPSSVRVPFMDFVAIKVHRILAHHGPGEMCAECPALCRHCGHVGEAGSDHTCPCPYGDDDCPDHPQET